MKTIIFILSVIFLVSCEKEVIEVEKKELASQQIVYHNIYYTLPSGWLITKQFVLAEDKEIKIEFGEVMRGKQVLKVWDDNNQVAFDTIYSNQSRVVYYNKDKKLTIKK